MDETVWLIERYLPDTQGVVWLRADGTWTAVAQQAEKYTAQTAAEYGIKTNGLEGQAWATKHVFIN
jgi:hypothetical protein